MAAGIDFGAVVDDAMDVRQRIGVMTMNDSRPARLLAYITAHNTLTLATEQNGRPWASSLFYANDGFTLYFVSDPDTQHAKNLKGNP